MQRSGPVRPNASVLGGAVRRSHATELVPLLQLVTGRDPLTVMTYVRLPLELRNVEALLFEHGIDIGHDTIRHGCNRSGPMFAGDVRETTIIPV